MTPAPGSEVVGVIDRLSWRGHGVLLLGEDPAARWLSVPGVEVGERVRVQVAVDARGGRLLEVIEPAPTRIAAPWRAWGASILCPLPAS